MRLGRRHGKGRFAAKQSRLAFVVGTQFDVALRREQMRVAESSWQQRADHAGGRGERVVLGDVLVGMPEQDADVRRVPYFNAPDVGLFGRRGVTAAGRFAQRELDERATVQRVRCRSVGRCVGCLRTGRRH